MWFLIEVLDSVIFWHVYKAKTEIEALKNTHDVLLSTLIVALMNLSFFWSWPSHQHVNTKLDKFDYSYLLLPNFNTVKQKFGKNNIKIAIFLCNGNFIKAQIP